MKKTILILVLGLAGCNSPVHDWRVVGKEPYYVKCSFTYDNGARSFTDSCDKYNVGQEIPHSIK